MAWRQDADTMTVAVGAIAESTLTAVRTWFSTRMLSPAGTTAVGQTAERR
jgi:hypothetical protein